MVKRTEPLVVLFYQTASGRQPVRDWLMTLTKDQRKTVGVDIWKAQSEWPIGMPHVRAMGENLHEIKSNFPEGIARNLFYVNQETMVLLHGFFKKTQKTPSEELALAKKRKKDHEQNQET